MAIDASAVTFALLLVGLIVVVKAIRVVPQQHAWVVERSSNHVIAITQLAQTTLRKQADINRAEGEAAAIVAIAEANATAMAVVNGESAAGQRT